MHLYIHQASLSIHWWTWLSSNCFTVSDRRITMRRMHTMRWGYSNNFIMLQYQRGSTWEIQSSCTNHNTSIYNVNEIRRNMYYNNRFYYSIQISLLVRYYLFYWYTTKSRWTLWESCWEQLSRYLKSSILPLIFKVYQSRNLNWTYARLDLC